MSKRTLFDVHQLDYLGIKTNFSIIVKLVERNPCPNGFQLVDPDKSGKKNQFDLVELAANIQTVSSFNIFAN